MINLFIKGQVEDAEKKCFYILLIDPLNKYITSMYFNIQSFSEKIRDFKNLIRNTEKNLNIKTLQDHKNYLFNQFDTFEQMRQYVLYLYTKGLINIQHYDKAMSHAEDLLKCNMIEKFKIKLMLAVIYRAKKDYATEQEMYFEALIACQNCDQRLRILENLKKKLLDEVLYTPATVLNLDIPIESFDIVRKNFKELVFKYHPDRSKHHVNANEEYLLYCLEYTKAINAVYVKLSKDFKNIG